MQTALQHHQAGRLQQADVIYRQILRAAPDHPDALHLSGLVAYQEGKSARAVELISRAIRANPNSPRFYNNLGLAFRAAGNLDAAVESYRKAAALKPDHVEAHFNLGNVLRELKQHQAALESYDRAIAYKPDHAEAHYRRGLVLQDIKQHQAALESFDRAIALQPDHIDAHINRGNALWHLQQPEAALACYDRAIAYKPDFADAHYNRGNVLRTLKQYEAALASYDRALALKPDYAYLYALRLQTAMLICDWRDAASQLAELAAKIARGEQAATPFHAVALTDAPALQHEVAKIWVRDKFPADRSLPEILRRPRHGKIRVGYFSADFRNHPVSVLTVQLFELHDRTKFELSAFCFSPDTGDDLRKRVMASFDRFINVQHRSDRDIALLAREMEIDIAVDLGGFTQNSRTGIFAMRAAPVQVNYLGYPGTMGAAYMDYIIADPVVIPEPAQIHYSEKIARLPCFMPNDTTRLIADADFTRETFGLPPTGFVFCCFNNSYKITPATFDGWMRILDRVEGSVLWLPDDKPQATLNLRKEAALRGIDPARLIFAPRLPLPEEHLARHRLADLFLDTLPYNAHATACDALWAGLPVLTCTGETFAGRVAASLLNAVHLPELIARTREEYESLAVALATHPDRLRGIRNRLAENRLDAPLFDTPAFARRIEAVYTAMYERHQAGLPPEHLNVGED